MPLTDHPVLVGRTASFYLHQGAIIILAANVIYADSGHDWCTLLMSYHHCSNAFRVSGYISLLTKKFPVVAQPKKTVETWQPKNLCILTTECYLAEKNRKNLRNLGNCQRHIK